jgi:hypothetical protein
VTVRYALAAAFVGVVAALIAVRDAGFLGGRADGGPLRVALEPDGAFSYELEGEPVRVQDVRFRFVSPGATVIGPTLAGGRLLEDAELEDAAGGGAVRLRARRRGVYYALDGTVDYRRGQRRFRTPIGRACVSVRLRADCSAYDGPGDAEVAEMGGPARYGEADFDGATAVFAADAAAVRLTLTSRRRGGLALARVRGSDDVAVGASSPSTFRLRPLGSRSLFLRLEGCGRLEALRAEVDGDEQRIPLSVPIELRCPAGGG